MQYAGKTRLALALGAALITAQISRAEPVVEQCATDPKLLGLSRIVEIDTTEGPEFGASHTGTEFLQDHEVVLTFDDGPLRPYTRPVLKALAEHCTKATFFMVGRMAASDPAMVKEVAAQGHTIGSHTFAHRNLKVIGLLKGRQELEMGISTVSKARGGPIAPFFRFPYLSESRVIAEYARQRHISVFSVHVDSKDYTTRDPDAVRRRVMNQLAVSKKGIILFHDIQPSTAKGLKALLTELHDKGFKVVHMVPKTMDDTIANFDSAAGNALAAKAQAAAANPLAERSVVWTMAPPAGAKAPNGKTTVAAPGAKEPSGDAAGDEQLPWLEPNPKKAVEPPGRPKRTARPKAEEKPWQFDIFQY